MSAWAKLSLPLEITGWLALTMFANTRRVDLVTYLPLEYVASIQGSSMPPSFLILPRQVDHHCDHHCNQETGGKARPQSHPPSCRPMSPPSTCSQSTKQLSSSKTRSDEFSICLWAKIQSSFFAYNFIPKVHWQELLFAGVGGREDIWGIVPSGGGGESCVF